MAYVRTVKTSSGATSVQIVWSSLRDLVLARIIEPTSKIDAERVLLETEVAAASYRTVKRRLPMIAKPAVRQSLGARIPHLPDVVREAGDLRVLGTLGARQSQKYPAAEPGW